MLGANVARNGVFQGSGDGDNFGFRIQAEDTFINPNGQWRFDNDVDGGNQQGFQGDGYLVFGDEDSDQTNGGGAAEADTLRYNIFIPEDELGTYNLQLTSSRDPGGANDRRNDVFVNIEGQGDVETDGILDILNEQGSEPEFVRDGAIKVFTVGRQQENGFGVGRQFDGAPDNPEVELEFTEAGFYTIEIGGRSEGYHFDQLELFKGDQPNEDSVFVENGNNNFDLLAGENNNNDNEEVIVEEEVEEEVVEEVGDDRILGSRDADTLQGGDLRDILVGRGGDDIIDGGAGQDRIVGGQGNDTLTGGEGRDAFVVARDTGRGTQDIVTDFNADEDLINFRRVDGEGNNLDAGDISITSLEDGSGVEVSVEGGESLILNGVAEDEISEDSFLFDVA